MMPADRPNQPAAASPTVASSAAPVQGTAADSQAAQSRWAVGDTRRWWIKLCLQPLLFLCAGAALFTLLGLAQRQGLLTRDRGDTNVGAVADPDVRYICPMMCTPPQAEPGRCPVCEMELVPATSSTGPADPQAVRIPPAARRLANIQTVTVEAAPVTRTLRTVGQLSYDEGALKTLSAYVDGRIERLYADYTGAVVNQGDQLALVYSPRLYSSQVEFLLARRSLERPAAGNDPNVARPHQELYASARRRLMELGMTEPQVDRLEQLGQASSRMELVSPIAGTVIEKPTVEGQYVKEGDVIYRLADLSTVWLMLELFPADAASIRYGQRVTAEVQSLPGRSFRGRVAFVDPQVAATTRTVGVRVVVPNKDGVLRVGDYAKATMEVPVVNDGTQVTYDAELADKWISPRHPHVISDSPGACPICGVPMVPAAQFGFASQPAGADMALIVPRDAVLMAGTHSVVYVETEPGRFELRRVVLGPTSGDRIVICSGVEEGERVATRGNFLIDSQMQLAGNPSLIDPTKFVPGDDHDALQEIEAALAGLSDADRALVMSQKVCPVAGVALGSMGVPGTVELKGTKVFICCEGCRQKVLSDPEKYLAKLGITVESEADLESAPREEARP